MERDKSKIKYEAVRWELPASTLESFRDYCRTRQIKECDAVCAALKRYLSDRLLEEGE